MVTMASNLATSTVSSSPTQGDVTTTTVVAKKSSENRRSNKPIMEKRRRARINNSLNELKTLILDATKKDPARHSKLEKADILEMTVKHLESLQRQQVAMSAVTDPQIINKFKAGFSECAGEVGRFPGLEPAVRRRLLQHLAHCLGSTTPSALSNNNNNSLPLNQDLSNRIAQIQQQPQQQQTANLQVHIIPSYSTDSNSSSSSSSSNNNVSNNGVIQNGGSILLSTGSATSLRLLPTRLPNGDIALVLPSVCTTVTSSQRLSSSSPSSPPCVSSSSPPPLAVLAPSRTASNGSATSSSNSPIGFERLSVNTNSPASSVVSSSCTVTHPTMDDRCHSPSSSAHSVYSSGPGSPLVSSGTFYDRSPSPAAKPLSLVVREEVCYYSEDKPWRPW